MERWFIKNKKGNVEEISKKHRISPFLSRLLINRDIVEDRDIEAYLNKDVNLLYEGSLLSDMDRGIESLIEDINSAKSIRIVGDFDVDGVMSVYILYKGLKALNAKVDYIIPNRVEDGYGINKDIIKMAKEEGIDTIITCDNGIAALEEVEYANSLGLKVIVTDHHDYLKLEDENGKQTIVKPQAYAVINPKDPYANYPFDKICGAVVALKLIEGLHKRLSSNVNILYELIEFAAIATICDVVDLVDENRIITKLGLEKLNRTENIGLKALIKESSLEGKDIGVYHVGFILGPSINASGRLDTALKALDLLLEEDESQAGLIACQLRELNEERKAMTSRGVDLIIKEVEARPIDRVIVVYRDEIHESIAGIIAGRIKDRYNRPTIVLTKGQEGVKGSARSIEGYNIFEELTKVKGCLNRFGGHPMAAGMSLDYDKLKDLREGLNSNCSLSDEDLIPKRYIDFPLNLEDLSFQLVKELEKLAPFGKGNSRPSFGAIGVEVVKIMFFGKNKNVIKLLIKMKNNDIIEGIIFEDHESFKENLSKYFDEKTLDKMYNGINEKIYLDIIYGPTINEFNGRKSLQVNIDSYRGNSK